jgi:alpha-1,6-mannosyltransferase
MEAYPGFRDPEKIVLVIGGHGPYEHRLKPFLKRYPEVVRLPFVTEREEVAKLMASADVFLSMSNDETFGLAAAEAMACGTQVVAPDAGAAAELLRRSGVLEPYRARDATSLVEHIRAAIDRRDDERAEKLRSYAQSYDWAVTFDRISRFYERIVAAKRANSVGDLVPMAPERWHEWEPPPA